MTDDKTKKPDLIFGTESQKIIGEFKTITTPFPDLPRVTLDNTKPINLHSLSSDSSYDDSEEVIELRKSLNIIFGQRFNEKDPSAPAVKSYKALSMELNMDWRTLKNFHEGGKVAKKVIEKLISKFKAVTLNRLNTNYEFVDFIDGKESTGMIIDIDIPKNQAVGEYMDLIEKAHTAMHSIYKAYWHKYPANKILKLKRISELQKNPIFENLSGQGVAFFKGILPSFMNIPKDHKDYGSHNGTTKVLYIYVAKTEQQSIDYVPDWDQLTLREK